MQNAYLCQCQTGYPSHTSNVARDTTIENRAMAHSHLFFLDTPTRARHLSPPGAESAYSGGTRRGQEKATCPPLAR